MSLIVTAPGRAESGTMPSAPPDFVETGAPSFVVLGPEAMGLRTAPTDLHVLPDGRVLVIAQREIAFSDGVRWTVHRTPDAAKPINSVVAVDTAGAIYAGIKGAFARIDFTADAHWSLTPVSHPPAGANLENSTMISVTMVGDDWYWFGGGGAIVRWRPDHPPKVVGNVRSVEHLFARGGEIYVSEQSSGGGLFRLLPDGGKQRVNPEIASETVTCSAPLSATETLVGMNYGGLKRFDGTSLLPFAAGAIFDRRRIADLCVVGDGLFAAAVDTLGIVFFDREGRTVQVLERALDHRLARVQRLVYAPNGVLWAMLNDGIARVQFPSPVSHFEPLLASGMSYVKPLRHEGRLWLLAEGIALRGVYTAKGRLEHFEPETPPGRYLFALTAVNGELFGSNQQGIFLYENEAWQLAVPGIVNARVLRDPTAPQRALFVARGEFGFIRRGPDGFAVDRFRVPELGDNYNAIEDRNGVVWLELGSSRVGRVDLRGAQPRLEILDRAHGLTDGWVEAYLFDGLAHFHLPNHLFVFDEQTRRFVDDHALLKRFPQLINAGGRPILDRFGRLWYSGDGAARMIAAADTAQPRPRVTIPVAFSPTEYTVEDNGVVWMFERRRLARVDLRVTPPAAGPLRALVTSVKLPASGRELFQPAAALAPLDYTDNSLVFHFAAPANPFLGGVTFETLLEGSGADWVSTGSIGSAAFNRLKEGRYAFRVRPVDALGVTGAEARIEFAIQPPWFRTPLAWTIYIAGAIGLVGFLVWLSSFLQRRENERLERLVTERTHALNATNRQLERQIGETREKSAALSASEERYRSLNADLERRVQERTAELSRSNDEIAHRESLFRLIFEHAPVGISWKRTDLGEAYHFNPTFCRILELPDDASADERMITSLVHPDDAPRHAELRRSIATGQTDTAGAEMRFTLRSGRNVWAAVSVAVIRDATGRVVQDIGILEDITARKQAERELADTYKELLDASRMAGMAEVATGVLHNVGNVLNSLNVSAGVIASRAHRPVTEKLGKVAALLHAHAHDLPRFLAEDPKGRLVPNFLSLLAEESGREQDWLRQEIASMQRNIDHIKEIVAMQQGYARVVGVVETLEPATLFDDAVRINSSILARDEVTIVREFLPVPIISVEKGKVLQILVNLIRNAKFACDDAKKPSHPNVITLRIEPQGDDRVRFVVRDTGVGIAPENLTRIFEHGFTTRSYGHGFGLHASAIAAKEMKGTLTVFSAGPGAGATFTLELPLSPDQDRAPDAKPAAAELRTPTHRVASSPRLAAPPATARLAATRRD